MHTTVKTCIGLGLVSSFFSNSVISLRSKFSKFSGTLGSLSIYSTEFSSGLISGGLVSIGLYSLCLVSLCLISLGLVSLGLVSLGLGSLGLVSLGLSWTGAFKAVDVFIWGERLADAGLDGIGDDSS